MQKYLRWAEEYAGALLLAVLIVSFLHMGLSILRAQVEIRYHRAHLAALIEAEELAADLIAAHGQKYRWAFHKLEDGCHICHNKRGR